MKIFCKSCGCHFRDEFERTLRKTCSFWYGVNLEGLPKKYKKRVWDWFFSLHSDEIADKTGYLIELVWRGSNKKYKGNEFEATIPGYKDWPDKKRRAFQKDYFKFLNSLTDEERSDILTNVFLRRNGKWLEKET